MKPDVLIVVSTRPDPRPAPADPAKVVPRVCPGLSLSASSIEWVDSLGHAHDLLREKRLSPGEAAIQLKRSTESVLRLIRGGQLYPAIHFNERRVEVYGCAIADYIARGLLGAKGAR